MISQPDNVPKVPLDPVAVRYRLAVLREKLETFQRLLMESAKRACDEAVILQHRESIDASLRAMVLSASADHVPWTKEPS